MIGLLIAQGGTLSGAVVIGLVLLFLILAFAMLVAKLMVVGNPSELLVISGKQGRAEQGYRTLIGGRTFVWPIIEKVALISLRNMQVALEVKAQSGGGTMIPVSVNGVANVKVSSDPEIRGNAIERFLGQPQTELQRVARETLEGGLRAVIGKMTPEEIVEDRDKFVATVMREVTDDFRKLGMVIDSVNIQNVHDDEQYLESIARKASAQVRADARQYEATKKSDADIREAEADAKARQAQAEREAEAKTAEAMGRQKAEEARLYADTAIAEAENGLRIRQAELAREAELKEAQTQEARGAAEEQRLIATQVKQAQAARDVAKAKAEGDAAHILEEGKARATAIEQIGKAIQERPDALKVMLTEMLPEVVQEITKTVANVELGNVTVIDSGDGRAIAGAALGRARMLAESMATLESVLGIDLRSLTQGIAGNLGNAKKPSASAVGAAPGAK
ncbi:MAG TPA: SPFH domain-containing protein [Phycisphaerae bacterium]|nr:SPFH domain-containing protein [Phycisphaerae bacterium]